MVSAIFHSPLESAPPTATSAERSATHSIAVNAHGACTKAVKDPEKTVAALSAKPQRDFSALWLRVLPPLLGLGLLVLPVVPAVPGGDGGEHHGEPPGDEVAVALPEVLDLVKLFLFFEV